VLSVPNVFANWRSNTNGRRYGSGSWRTKYVERRRRRSDEQRRNGDEQRKNGGE
jgi:hypothetical protein